MRQAFSIAGPKGGTVEIREAPTPQPGQGQVLIQVRASALNRSEVTRRLAQILESGATAPPPELLGIECSGEVVLAGPGVTRVAVGERVMCRCTGSHAEYVVVDQRAAMPVPAGMSWTEAASIPNVFVTAHDALTASADLKPGESVLVNAASSGVGIAALQVARVMGAGPIIGTSSSPAKLDRLHGIGMDVGILTSEPLADAVRAATAGKGVDVVIDSVGGTVLDATLRAMVYKGRMVQVGRLGASTSEIDLDFLARWRLRLIGTSFRQRNAEETLAASEAFVAAMLPAFADGRLQPVVDRVFPFDDLPAAHAYMESNAQVGKIVVSVSA